MVQLNLAWRHELMPTTMPVLAIMTLASASLLFQLAPVTGGDFSSYKDLGLTGALIVAVGVLWRQTGKKDDKLDAKDAMIVEMVKTVTAALVTAAESNKELRAIIKESVDTKLILAHSIDSMRTALIDKPCLADADIQKAMLKFKSDSA